MAFKLSIAPVFTVPEVAITQIGCNPFALSSAICFFKASILMV
jgi:hypothetical protein